MTDAATTMDCQTAGFIDHQQPLVLVNYLLFEVCYLASRRRFRAGIDPCRRNPDFVTGDKFVLGPHPAAIHTHLAPTQNPVQPPFRQARQLPAQKVIDSLARLLVIDTDFAHSGLPGAVGDACGIIHKK